MRWTAYGSSFLIGPVEMQQRPIVDIKEIVFDAQARTFRLEFARGGAAVILCSPHKHHAAQIKAAAAAGKHVFCEKPLCTRAEDVEDAVAAIRKAGVQLGIGHERRFEPAVIEMRKRFAAGEFGNSLLLEGNFSQDKFFALPPDNWRLSPVEAPVGPLSATGIHLVDLSIGIFGQPKEVWARLATRGSTFGNGDTLSLAA